MAKDNPYFWTDLEQTTARIAQTVILYDDKPVYIQTIHDGATYDDRTHRATILECGKTGDVTDGSRKKLDSPKFKRFRELPKLGWMNHTKLGAVYTSRKTVRTTKHGLCDTNVSVNHFQVDAQNCFTYRSPVYQFRSIWVDKGFVDMHSGKYPSLEGILSKIVNNSAIAYSPVFAVMRDEIGVRWLFRGPVKIGIFTGVDTLMLLSQHAYLREEIMEDAAFTVNTIREF